jgi:hypothetical protein
MILTLAFLLSQTSLMAQQQLPEWYRVYTFDDSIIEMNTLQIMFNVEDFGRFGRVIFRWSFDKPEALRGEPQRKYKSRMEVIEFDCSDRQRYRPVGLTFFDVAGKVIRSEKMNPPNDWRDVNYSDMMKKLASPACPLIHLRSQPSVVSSETVEKEKAEKFAISFLQRLEKGKDFAPLVKEFFAPDYLGGYLRDKETNRFLLLNPDVAAKVSRAELQRYNVALLNIGYLGSLYFVSQAPSTSDEYNESGESVPDEKLVPPGIFNLVKNHPYTAAYKGMKSNYDFLAESIDSPERLRLYTDLLEKIAALFRRNLIKVSAENSKGYFAALNDLEGDTYDAQIWVCSRECFGLPEGTKLFQVDVPVFRLQIAEINGEMKIVSAIPNFQ